MAVLVACGSEGGGFDCPDGASIHHRPHSQRGEIVECLLPDGTPHGAWEWTDGGETLQRGCLRDGVFHSWEVRYEDGEAVYGTCYSDGYDVAVWWADEGRPLSDVPCPPCL